MESAFPPLSDEDQCGRVHSFFVLQARSRTPPPKTHVHAPTMGMRQPSPGGTLMGSIRAGRWAHSVAPGADLSRQNFPPGAAKARKFVLYSRKRAKMMNSHSSRKRKLLFRERKKSVRGGRNSGLVLRCRCKCGFGLDSQSCRCAL